MGARTWGAVAAALALLTPATAKAMEIGMQDEQVIVDRLFDRDLALQQFQQMGGTHVRINITHRYGPADGPQDLEADAVVEPIERYEDAIAAVRSAGLIPQVSLVWYGQEDPRTTATWMGRVAALLGPSVNRYSVLNEPDLTIRAADDCDPETIRELIDSGALPTKTVTQWFKRYLRHRVRVRRHGKVVRVWRPVRQRKRVPIVFNGKTYHVFQRVRRYTWAKRPVEVVRLADGAASRETVSVKTGCQAIIRGRKYRQDLPDRRAGDGAADPGAQLLAGETSPHPGFEMFVRNVRPITANSWAPIPTSSNRVIPPSPPVGLRHRQNCRIKDIVGMPLYYTEFGYPRPGAEWDLAETMTEQTLARLLPGHGKSREQAVCGRMLQFGWYSPHADWEGAWNTSLLHTGDGTTWPAYEALRALSTP